MSQLPIRSLRPGELPPEGEPRRYKASHGYVRVRWRVDNELVECYEHRWVMGVYDPSVQVHHKNGVRDDNRPENLEVVTAREHGREHRRIDRQAVVDLYVNERLSTPEVGKRLGCDAAHVYRILMAEGVSPRRISESLRLELPDDTIRTLHGQGVSARGIARRLGVSSWAIDARVKSLGLTPHRPGRPAGVRWHGDQ